MAFMELSSQSVERFNHDSARIIRTLFKTFRNMIDDEKNIQKMNARTNSDLFRSCVLFPLPCAHNLSTQKRSLKLKCILT